MQTTRSGVCASVFDAELNNFNSCKRREAAYTVEESPNGRVRYCYDYSDEELDQFVPIIKAAEREGKKVQVILMVAGQRMG